MESVLNLQEKLKNIEGVKNPVVLAFSNFLKHYKSPGDSFDLNCLESFCRRAYSFEYWRKEMPNFQEHLKRILSYLFTNADCKVFSQSLFLQKFQWLHLEHKRDFLSVVDAHAKTKDVSYRFFELNQNEILVIYTWKNGNKALQLLNTLAYVADGVLHPLTTDEIIYYEANLDLLPFATSHACIGPFQHVIFEKNYQHYKIKKIRGYTLQLVEEKLVDRLQEDPKLFYTLKRFESLLVGKDNHPLYEELTKLLEDALNLLHSKDPRALRLAYTALERGKNAVENIFPNDKLLQLLLKEVAANLQRALEGSEAHGSPS